MRETITVEAEGAIMTQWEHESELRLWPGCEIEMEPQSVAESQTESEPQSVTEPQTESESRSVTELQTESEPQSAAERQPESEVQTELQQEQVPENAQTVVQNAVVEERSYAVGDLFGVDRIVPQISVEGVKDQSANNGAVKIRVSCEDSNYKEGSFLVSITGLNQGESPDVKQSREQEDGAWVQYYDFPNQKKYDDVYQLLATAEDLAGNRTEYRMEFSVNRFGSVFEVSEKTKEQVTGYYLAEAVDIVFNEINIDYVEEMQLFCRCDGELQMLTAGSDYQASMSGGEHSWKQYQYTIPAEYFVKDGIYELVLMSVDKASNVNDAGKQGKRVLFVLDRTKPGCVISGIRSGMSSEKERELAFVTPYDNSEISGIRVYNNEKLIWEKTENVKTDQTFTVGIEKAQNWQKIQVWVRDFAGNEFWSEQIPVYIYSPQEPNTETEVLHMRRRDVILGVAGTAGFLCVMGLVLVIAKRREH